ncbi:hypothetical protein JR316_0011563 [Psilocybe cubensis]|uniref:Secreted protein n=2 Tax=Psilocybe cubensis TaxID=181762 RepID=A0A8H7XUS6_PSICU|nr:hypothetical protein JR316_0011563 [Psilocybe cubensis]KAH9475996.1 hypothetical protein JR316_0011563 [Psilocybe cubensis]
MQFRTTTAAAALLTALSLATGAAAVTCAVCAPTITFSGVVRTLTLVRQESGNTVQCNYDTPAIPGFSPGCLYGVSTRLLKMFGNGTGKVNVYLDLQNVNGALIFTNAGTACPSTIPLVTKTSC